VYNCYVPTNNVKFRFDYILLYTIKTIEIGGSYTLFSYFQNKFTMIEKNYYLPNCLIFTYY